MKVDHRRLGLARKLANMLALAQTHASQVVSDLICNDQIWSIRPGPGPPEGTTAGADKQRWRRGRTDARTEADYPGAVHQALTGANRRANTGVCVCAAPLPAVPPPPPRWGPVAGEPGEDADSPPGNRFGPFSLSCVSRWGTAPLSFPWAGWGLVTRSSAHWLLSFIMADPGPVLVDGSSWTPGQWLHFTCTFSRSAHVSRTAILRCPGAPPPLYFLL